MFATGLERENDVQVFPFAGCLWLPLVLLCFEFEFLKKHPCSFGLCTNKEQKDRKKERKKGERNKEGKKNGKKREGLAHEITSTSALFMTSQTFRQRQNIVLKAAYRGSNPLRLFFLFNSCGLWTLP